MSRFVQAAALVASLAATVSAHGRVISVSAGGKEYEGFINDYLYGDGPPADLIAWSAQNGDNGFVDPASYTTSDIACHKQSAPGGGSAKVAAGSTVTVTWGPDVWPESHHGPVLDYLAKCAGDCTSASPGDLSFFKIGEAGLNDGSTAPGNWASDDLIAAGGKWDITIPATLAPGQYVLRHEIIALHSAGDENGAQNYPQCFNLEVTGSGSASPPAVSATELYTPSDAGIKVSIYTAPLTYEIPGPALWDGASSGGSPPPAEESSSAAPAPSSPATSYGGSSPETSVAPSSPATSYVPSGTAAPSAPSGSGSTGYVPYPTEGAPYPSTSSAAAPATTSAPAYSPPPYSAPSSDVPIGAVTESASSAPAAPTSSAAAPQPTGSYGGGEGEEEPSQGGAPGGYGGSEGKPLPEGVSFADFLGWVNYYLKKGFNADGVHARDVVISRR